MSIAPPKPTVVLAPGDVLDRYQLLCPIAEGGMGVCWLARVQSKHGFEKLVAIKMMKPEYALDPMFQQMFVDEARIASGIEHANVAAILDIGDKDGALYLAMEYVDGDALNKLMREIRSRSVDIPQGVALRILADTCGGLHAAHELGDATGNLLGVVHRDVSPQNILINVKGAAKLIDFGIAKARDRTSGDTSLGTIKGKIHYMAPEQAVGRGDLDRRADVFSVGAILYQLLSGKRAFEAESEVATILLLASGRPPIPLPRTVPAPVAAVIMKALQNDRARRYATALEMQHALEDAMVQSSLVTPTAVVGDFMKEHLGHRAEKRRKTIDAALAALAGGKPDPASVARAMRISVPDADEAPRSTSEISSTKLGIGPAPGAAPVEGTPVGRPGATDAALALDTDPASRSLTASSVSEAQWRPPPPRSAMSVAVLVVGPMFALAGIVLGAVALRHHESGAPAGAAQTASAAPRATGESTPSASASPTADPAATSAAPAETAPPASASASASGTTTATGTPPPRAREGTGRPRVAPTAPTASTSTSPTKKKAVDDGF